MHTQRSIENKGTKKVDKIQAAIEEEVENEESELGVEDLDSNDQI